MKNVEKLRWIRFSKVNNNKMDEELCGRLEVQNGHFYPPAKLFHQGTELNPPPFLSSQDAVHVGFSSLRLLSKEMTANKASYTDAKSGVL
jgi:hypothetical protein